jgi:hypothetical protein
MTPPAIVELIVLVVEFEPLIGCMDDWFAAVVG